MSLLTLDTIFKGSKQLFQTWSAWSGKHKGEFVYQPVSEHHKGSMSACGWEFARKLKSLMQDVNFLNLTLLDTNAWMNSVQPSGTPRWMGWPWVVKITCLSVFEKIVLSQAGSSCPTCRAIFKLTTLTHVSLSDTTAKTV